MKCHVRCRLQVAQEHHKFVLDVSLTKELDEARDYSTGLLFSHIDLLDVQCVGIWVLLHRLDEAHPEVKLLNRRHLLRGGSLGG